jgi:hypothetical protein
MPTDKLMTNAESDRIKASKRARALTAITGLMLVLWLAVVVVTQFD